MKIDNQTSKVCTGILASIFMNVSTARILDFLLTYSDLQYDYTEAEIARHAGVSQRQVYRSLPILIRAGLLYTINTTGLRKKYKLDTNSPAIFLFQQLLFSLIDNKSQIPSTTENTFPGKFKKGNHPRNNRKRFNKRIRQIMQGVPSLQYYKVKNRHNN